MRKIYILSISLFITDCKTAFFSSSHSQLNVVNGKKTTDFPELQQIELYDRAVEYAGSCSGVWIRPNIILTAAHCFDDAPHATVLMGKKEYPRTQIFIHPEYKPLDAGNIKYDLALLKVEDVTAPAIAEIGTEKPKIGDSVTLVGIGKNSFTTLPGVKVGIKRCGVNEIDSEGDGFFQILFQNKKKGAGAAPGDSGGPLYFGDKVVGVSSVGSPEGKGAFANHYVDLSSSYSTQFFDAAKLNGFF